MAPPLQVPYVDGLAKGQGYNTYDQSGCMFEAVVERGASNVKTSSVEITYTANQISDYTKLVETLDISAAAGVSKLEAGGSVEASFLNRKEFETSFLTYVVKVDVRQQPSSLPRYSLNWVKPTNPQKSYGDRFISGFVEGGALFARVSIFTKDSSSKKDVSEAAKVAFPVFGAGISVSQEVKTSMETIHKHSEVQIYLHYVGAPPSAVVNLSDSQADDLLQLKKIADDFLLKAQQHQWKRFALLEKYSNLPNWEDQFSPLDYSYAKDISWTVFNDFSGYTAIRDKIHDIKEAHYTGGRETRHKLDFASNDAIEIYRKWIDAVKLNPEAAKTKPGVRDPQTFNTEVLLSVKRTRYIAQSLRLPDNRRTHIIDTRLRDEFKAQKLFEFEAYDFGEVADTANLLFQVKKDAGTSKYSCVIGRSKTPGYDEMSHLWVADQKIEGVLDLKIDVLPIPSMGIIELSSDGEFNEPDILFSFYVRKP